MPIDYRMEYTTDPSEGAGAVTCTACGERGRVVESGSVLDAERVWNVEWEREASCPAGPGHHPVPVQRRG